MTIEIYLPVYSSHPESNRLWVFILEYMIESPGPHKTGNNIDIFGPFFDKRKSTKTFKPVHQAPDFFFLKN